MRDSRGFTLLELIAACAVLLTVLIASLIVLRPHDYGGELRDGERQADMAQILGALKRYQADHGQLPEGITIAPKTIGSQNGELNLCGALVPAYLKDLPIDPVAGGKISKQAQDLTGKPCTDSDVAYTTGYRVSSSNDGQHMTVSALTPEAAPKLSITGSR